MLKTTLFTSTLALAIGLAAPGISFAQQHAADVEAKFKSADKDNDGTLDKEEAKAMPRVAKHFDAIDTDKDGTVSLEEVKASMMHAQKAMHDKAATVFKNADKDNDGTLDKEEAKAMPRVAKNFDAIDADNDGTVSMQEIQTYMKAHRGGGKQNP